MRNNYDAIQELDTEVLAISTDRLSGAERAVDYLDLGFPILFDPEAKVVDSYGVYNLLDDNLATPSTFVIDKTGMVRWKYIGRNSYDRPSNQEIIARLKELAAR